MKLLLYPILFLLMLYNTPAWSARPFVTDDARLTTEGSCQVETWSRAYKDSMEFWALPACNPSGNLEITLGGGSASYSDKSKDSNSDYVFQVKTLLKKLDTNGIGYGIALGTVRHPAVNPGPNLLGNSYAYLPISTSFLDDKVVLHVNVGWLRENGSNRNLATWGLGAEFNVNNRITWMTESFGDNRANSYLQVGGRFSLIPQLLQIDTTVGQSTAGENGSKWISFGLRFTPARLF